MRFVLFSLLTATILSPSCIAATEVSKKIFDSPPGFYESAPSAKVLRRKIADIPNAEDRAYAEQKLKEFTEAVSGPKASPLCKGVSVFCRVNVPEGYVSFLNKYPREARALTAVGTLKVTLADIKNTEFRKFTLLGYIAEGYGSAPPWSSVARLFKEQNGDLVYLIEWDFVSEGGGIEQADEFQNAKVGAFDASAMRSISSNGRSLWDIEWVDARKRFKLYYYCNSDKCISQNGFVELANSIYNGK